MMEPQMPDDGLQWFGEGFDGFPRRLPDDCVEYIIHIIDDRLNNAAATRSRLNEVLKAANGLKREFLKDHIWQRDGFDLFLHPKISSSPPKDGNAQGQPHLQGRTNFGDSIADEWLIVYLLRELSRRFSDAWIRMHDGDGEFLLIEAANSLPAWLNPDIADNRIWLNDGDIKIIPLEPDSGPRNLTVDSALSYIRRRKSQLLIDTSIQKEAFGRIREYPSAIASSLHNALVTIPRTLAYLLHENSAYTSPAAEAFYLRDPISLKPLNTKDLANLTFPPEDFVTVSVKFTKVSYAQLRSQIFDAPPAWTGFIPRLREERASVGMKLTCGFEMLVSDPQSQSKRSVREIRLLLSDLESNNAALPSDADISTWPPTRDDEKWLDIDYQDFETELSDHPRPAPPTTKPGEGESKPEADDEATAHHHLRNLVSRFRDFMDADEDIGSEGGGDDDDDDAASSASTSSTTSASTVSSNDFRRAIDFTLTQTPSTLESTGLIAEARRLALETEGDSSEDPDEPTEEEVREVMARMGRELRDHGALERDDDYDAAAAAAADADRSWGSGKAKAKGKAKGKAKVKTETAVGASGPRGEQKGAVAKPFFGPERPPHLLSVVQGAGGEGEEGEDVGPGDEELSSDDEDEMGVNDVDLTFARNMLQAFKGQAGMSGPAGNLMRALGVGAMPRDEGEDGGQGGLAAMNIRPSRSSRQ